MALVGDTQMPLGAERGRFLFLHDVTLGLAGGLLLAAPHVGVEPVAGQQFAMPAALGDALSLPVEVSRRDTLNPLVRERMVEDAIKIF